MAAVAAVLSDAQRLRAGSLGWVRGNAGYLDSPSGREELPAVPRAKAFLQLARLYRNWARVAPGDPGSAEVGALVRRVWEGPELPGAFAGDPRYARQYSLMYCALAPDAGGPCREVLAALASGGYLSRPERSPYLRLEIAHYADMAGAGHGMGSYRELYAASLLAGRAAAPVGARAAGPPAGRAGALPVTDAEACTIAHTIFYLSDYGLRAPGLDRCDVERARRVVVELTWYFIELGEWDNAAKFVLAQFCLGLDPVSTPSGAAGIRMLAGVQETSGAIPCAAVGLMPGPAATQTQRFRKAYQTTLMTALMSLMVSSAGRR